MAQSKISATVAGKIDLGPDMPGYELELRNLVLEPGAANGMHSHAQRPGFSYVLKGILTESMAGGEAVECGPGMVITESRGVTHSVANRGTEPVELLTVHIKKKR
ncbi:MAG: cupin domain-containing protein [Rhodanobacteraceae bacterium]